MTPEPSNEYQTLVEADQLHDLIARIIESSDAFDCATGWTFTSAAREIAEEVCAALSTLAVSETAGRVQLKLPHADDAADPSSSEVAAQPQPALPHAGDDGQVAQSAYEAAVKGRQDFRQAYRELLPVQRAAQALSDYWRSPGSRYTEDEFLDLVNAVDVAVTGGGPTTSEMRAAIALRRTTPPSKGTPHV